MNSIFVRIYGGILVALLIIGALTYAGVELVNDYRSQLYRERMARGTFYLMAEGYRERAGDEERQAWSRSLSRMFGAPVTLRDAGELGLSYRDGLHLQEGRVVLRGNPDSERVEVLFAVPDDPLYIRAVMSRLSEQQARATAMLVLDYLRARPANRQDQALADLNQHFGYPLTLLPRTELDLDVQYAKIADACGLKGVQVTTMQELTDTLAAAVKDQMENKVTTFIEVILNQELGEPFRRDAMKAPVEVAGINPDDMVPQKGA